MTELENQIYERLRGKLRVFGDRVALVEVSEENDTGIYLPEDRQRAYVLGRVISVGDGVIQGEDKPRLMWLNEGDVVFYQLNGIMVKQCGCVVDNNKVLVIPQGDVIGTLDSTRLNADGFHVTGNWVLCQVEVPEKVGKIYLPDGGSVSGESARPRYYVDQLGPGVDLDVNIGDEVFVNPARIGVFKLKSVMVAYVDKAFVHACVK